jgi:hypothetical protein
MRFRLLRRRLTISAPSMAVRNHMPWPLRWALVAIVLGFCAAIALWAFEFGKNIAGLEGDTKVELQRLRSDMNKLREERDRAREVANTSSSQLATEKATQAGLASQVRQLEAENIGLRDDLGFFQTLMPLAGGAEGLAIRGLKAELKTGDQLRWQLLLVQTAKNAPEFNGRLDINIEGLLNGKLWAMSLPDGVQASQIRQYRRMEGVVTLPPQTVVKSVTVRLIDGNSTRATQTIKL